MMAPSSGDQFGHYVISEPLGAGGMGEVYRARDTRLDREVALKFLPEGFGSDSERLARFEREAKVLASVNHRNVATLHGLESLDSGELFLVMELVEGQDLSQKISDGPIPIGDAIRIAHQVAEGLEAAHAKGIVHRDLKPGNIRITLDGTVKILDFGLAKEWGSVPEDADFTESPTLTADMTRKGTILGTAPYLSPEQARGQAVDRRTDIWAFGCVLFEMITGRRAFSGDTSTEVIARVLERHPEWSTLPDTVAPSLRRLLVRCLEKDLNRRLRDAGDLALALEDLELEEKSVPAKDDRPATSPSAKIAPWFVAAAACVLAIVAWIGRPSFDRMNSPPVVRFVQSSPASLDVAQIGHFGPAVAISPDGQLLVWVGATQESTLLFMRRLDEDTVQPIDGSKGGFAPFFSPDGEWIGFFADEKLKKVSTRGGVPQTICEIEHLHGASWGDGVIVLEGLGDGELFRVDPRGDEIQKIEISNQPDYRGGYPTILPGSNAMLVSSQAGDTVDLLTLDTGEVTNLVTEGTHGTYLPTGHLVWTQGDNLLAAPFDLSRHEITGDAHTVVEGIVSETHVGLTSHYAVSNAGTLAYLPGTVATGGVRPVWVRLDGTTESLEMPAESSYLTPRISPDGRRLLISRQTESRSVWLYDLDRGVSGPVTSDEGNQFWAIWTPDGENMIFNSQQGGEPVNLWMQPIDRSSPPMRLTTAPIHHCPLDMTRDARTVLFVSRAAAGGGNLNIQALHLGGDPTIESLIASNDQDCLPTLSPDERWLAYASDASGRLEIYVKPYPKLDGTIRVSPHGGTEPIWSPKGDRLYYRSEDGRHVFAVDVLSKNPLRFGTEKLLFEGRFAPAIRWGRKWDIHPDGDRFLMLQLESSDAVEGIRVVTNWFTELERLVPAED
jgi:serine/threonine protein kinase/Tol biopolymer transport system component